MFSRPACTYGHFGEDPQVIIPNLGVPSLTRRVMISLQVGCRDLASDTWTPHPDREALCASAHSLCRLPTDSDFIIYC